MILYSKMAEVGGGGGGGQEDFKPLFPQFYAATRDDPMC